MKAIAKFQFAIIFVFAVYICCFAASGDAQTHDQGITIPPAITATHNPQFGKKAPAPQGQLDVYDHGDPTPEEQYELELINRARANPPAEGVLLFNTTDQYLLQNLASWKTPTPSDVKAAFATYPAQQPLAFNKDLIAAARRHSQDMLDHNYQDHLSPTDGSDPFTRMKDAGYDQYDLAGENIFAYGSDLDEINQEFEYDFGNPGLGHRENLINFGTFVYSEIGIGILHGGNGAPDVGPIITTEDFGHVPGNVFITGVVYGDDNHDNFYDVGEGLAGVTITVTGGSTSAVSSTSGGYAIPYTDNGSVTVTASGGPLTAPISHNVTLNGDNVKVDFVQGQTGFPDQPILIAPIADTIINTDTAHFSWSKSTGETKYWIQVATDSKMTKLIVKDSTVTIPARLLPKLAGSEKALLDGTTYYWQVRSKNVIGWGKFSPVDSFVVGLPPKAIALISPADKANTGTADVLFKWHANNPDANDYVIEVAKDSKFANDISNDTLNFGVTSEDTVFTIAGTALQAQTTYYWRVFADNDNGWNAPSAVRSFTTGGVSSVASSAVASQQISISPNPTSGETHIRFVVDRSADVSLKVFGVTGSQESLSALGMLEPNSYDIIWSAAGRSPGVYSYELSIGSRRETGRIIVIK